MYRMHQFSKFVFGASLILAALSCSTSSSPTSIPAAISENQARTTALAKVPGGTVQSAELEMENGRRVWSFDIATPSSRDLTEVQVDAQTGKVVSKKSETPKAEAEEAALEKEHK